MADQKEPFNWNGNEGEFIELKEASQGTADYRSSPAFKDNKECKAHYIGGKKLLKILSEGPAVGVRVYYAKAQADDPKRKVAKGDADVYLVGVDSAGNDILDDGNGNSLILNRSFPCPPWCPGGNGLNP